MRAICDDLEAEHEALDALVADLEASRWDTPTPAERWAVRDQIAHLAAYDVADMARCVGVDLWSFRDARGRGLRRATDFLAPYVGNKWDIFHCPGAEKNNYGLNPGSWVPATCTSCSRFSVPLSRPWMNPR